MSTWRRKALEFLPDKRVIIEKSENPSMLWIELYSDFIGAFEKEEYNRIESILKYLHWCASEESGKDDNLTHQAVFIGFLEDIANHKEFWPYFNKWFNRVQFENYKTSFKYTLSDSRYKQMESFYFGK